MNTGPRGEQGWKSLALIPVLACSPSGVLADFAVANKTVSYTGPITPSKNQALFRAAGDNAVNRLVITSSGGDVSAGIALGRWVHRNKLAVEVEDHCLSSCANYVFTAGARKIIRPGAVVAWHGNYHHLQVTGRWRNDSAQRRQKTGESLEAATRLVQAQVEELVSLERQFFTEIGVDQRICWAGKMPPYNAPNYYFLSARDMRRFGLVALTLPDNYTETDVSRFEDDVRLIRLAPH